MRVCIQKGSRRAAIFWLHAQKDMSSTPYVRKGSRGSRAAIFCQKGSRAAIFWLHAPQDMSLSPYVCVCVFRYEDTFECAVHD